MSNWHWLILGAVGGYVAAHVGGGASISFSAGLNAGRRPAGSGATPLDQPTGTEPYAQVGAYNPLFGAGFPDLTDPDVGTIIENNTGADVVH